MTKDNSIVIVESRTGRAANVLEAHTQQVRALSFSPDGRCLASRAGDGSPERDERLLLWDTSTWKIMKCLRATTTQYLFTGLAFSPVTSLLATSGQKDSSVQLWNLDLSGLAKRASTTRAVYYKNAKVALIGDTGVGKSALALVLAGNEFAPTDSTHGRKVTGLGSRKKGTGRYRSEIQETVLWDLAGQPGYRLIHQLHLGDVSLGVIVFDSRNELDPFAGVRHWCRVLNQAARRNKESSPTSPPMILVAARIDRGPVGVSKERIASLRREFSISAFLETSAKEGIGISQLRAQITATIPWESLPTLSSNLPEDQSVLARGARVWDNTRNHGRASEKLSSCEWSPQADYSFCL